MPSTKAATPDIGPQIRYTRSPSPISSLGDTITVRSPAHAPSQTGSCRDSLVESQVILPLARKRPSVTHSFTSFDTVELVIGLYDETFPLHRALQQRTEYLAKEILADGANPNLQTPDGLSPLHIAARAGASAPCVQKLLDHGADPSITDAHGNLPLHWAIRWNWAVAELLFGSNSDAGSTCNLKNDSPAHFALLSFRQGTCTLNQLNLIWSRTCRGTSYRGESARNHFLGSLCYNYDTSTRRGRTAWWESMITSTASPHPLEVLSTMPAVGYSLQVTAFPNSDVLLFESLLRELPLCANSEGQKLQLIHLGNALVSSEMVEFEYKPPYPANAVLDLFIEGRYCAFWQDYPGRIQWWMADLIHLGCQEQDCVHRDYHISSSTCQLLNMSLFTRAIHGLLSPEGAGKLSFTKVLIYHGLDAFRREQSGQIPLLTAAREGMQQLVELMLEADMKSARPQQQPMRRGQDLDFGRFYWAEWEEAKVTDDWHALVVLIDSARPSPLEGVSAQVHTLLVEAAMNVVLETFCKELPSMWTRVRKEKRAQVTSILSHCRRQSKDAESRIHEKLEKLHYLCV